MTYDLSPEREQWLRHKANVDMQMFTHPEDHPFVAAPEVLSLLNEIKDRRENPRDEYHTMEELYRYRLLYNAIAFNTIYKHWPQTKIYKSKVHSDGVPCFGGDYFIVVLELEEGQVSNHYKLEYWDYFQIPVLPQATYYDGHTPRDVADRLEEYIKRCIPHDE